MREYHQQNKEKISERKRQRYLRDKPKIIALVRKRLYGITEKEYQKMVEDQNGLCAICNQPEKVKGSLSVDHDHRNKKIRGLLCSACNRGMGLLKDNFLNLQAAADYLDIYAAQLTT